MARMEKIDVGGKRMEMNWFKHSNDKQMQCILCKHSFDEMGRQLDTCQNPPGEFTGKEAYQTYFYIPPQCPNFVRKDD